MTPPCHNQFGPCIEHCGACKTTEPEWMQTARRQDAKLSKDWADRFDEENPGYPTRADHHRHWLLVRYDEQAAEIVRLKQALQDKQP